MPRIHSTPSGFHRTLLALAAMAVLTPQGVLALDLMQGPPGSTEPYVAPNVIISIDDSGSMDWQITNQSTGSTTITAPKADGTWDTKAKRINVLKYALKQVFNDTSLLPDKKIRLAWQSMWNNGGSPGAGGERKCEKTGKNGSCTQWQTTGYGAATVDSAGMAENSMNVLQSTHRTNFLNFVDKITPSGSTPTHQMLKQADDYMRRSLSANGPWASVPGTTGAPYLGCRRNYHIVFTDGRWNGTISGGAQDDNTVNKSLPDGTVYGSSSTTARPYNNLYHDKYANTLADWAFHSWAEPLQTTGLTGMIEPNAAYRSASETENFGKDSKGKDAILERYWNPRYDPATWAHMVTYTIGVSSDATTWPGAPSIVGPTQQVPFGYDGSFPDLITGQKTWPNMGNGENVRALDLWHAALNGRGRFYAVMTGEDLEKAFREIIGSINTQTEPDMTSSATSGSNVSRNAVGKFTGNYEPKKAWKGFLTAETVKTDGSTEPAEGWQGQNTAARIDAMSAGARNIISWSDKKNASYQDQGGVEFKWASDETRLSAAQKLSLQQNIAGADQGAAQGEARLNYIRGDRSKEGATPEQPFRPRQSAQGDIINSDVWYTGGAVSNYALKGYVDFIKAQRDRSPILYVGGNDGMLHGFSADNGKEQLAYVPKGVIPRLRYLTDASFDQNHKFFVDGSPMTGDVDIDEKNHDASNPAKDWRTMLVGALGAGGKGYFVLDVTNPGSFDKNSALVDRTRSADDAAANCTALTGEALTTCQTVRDEDADIGYITAKPVKDDANPMRSTQITRLNNDRWAVVLGNGYNSTNQRPVLLIQYLDGARELKRIVAASDATTGSGRASDNGLSAPRLVDINGDLRMDVAYAGDNLGNLWKFDLTSDDASQWDVAFGGEPLFTASGPTALGDASRPNIQPITAPPTVRANDRFKCEVDAVSEKCKPGTSKAVGGMMVAFGTGRNVSKADESDVKVQTLYSVLDNTRYKLVDTIDGKRKRLEIHPGDTVKNIPAPAALGTGVDDAKLATQKITTATEDGRAYGTITPEAKVNWATHNGWYMDLPAIGERLLKPLEFYDGSNLLVMYSQVPAKGSDVDPDIESCTSTSVDKERQYRTFVNIMDGAKPSVKLMDTIGDFSRAEVAAGAHTLITRGNKVLDFGPKGGAKPGEDPGQPDVLNRMPEQSLRPSWRQIQ